MDTPPVDQEPARYDLIAVRIVALAVVCTMLHLGKEQTQTNALTDRQNATEAAPPSASINTRETTPAVEMTSVSGFAFEAGAAESKASPQVTPAVMIEDRQRMREYGEGVLIVSTRPAGARVTVDGIGWGVTPITIRRLPYGTKTIRVTKSRYAGEERLIRLDERTPRTTLRIPLRPN
jgi:hypothetical protein